MTKQNVTSALAAVGLASALVAGLSVPARADVLYDNLGETSIGSGLIVGEIPADSFSTGSSAFDLQDVKLLMQLSAPASGSFTVDLLSDNATSPGTTLTTLGTVADTQLTSSLGVVDLSLATPVSLAANTRYWIELTSTNSVAEWSFDADASGTGVAGEYWYNTSYGVQPNSGGPYQMEVSGTAVPEPATLALFGFGLAGLGMVRRRA